MTKYRYVNSLSFKTSKIFLNIFDYQKKLTSFISNLPTKVNLTKNTLRTTKTCLRHFFKKMHLKDQKKIYKIQVFLSQIDFEEIPFKSDINLTLLQDEIIIRLVNTQKILYFFCKKLNSIIKELIHIESKLVKIEHNFSQKNLAFKNKFCQKVHLILSS